MFDKNDSLPKAIPEEWKNKTPEELFKLMQEREATLHDQLDTAAATLEELKVKPSNPPPGNPPPVPKISSEEFWRDPDAAVDRKVQAAVAAARPAASPSNDILAIETAKMVAQKGLSDWAEWSGEIEQLMGSPSVTSEVRKNPQAWLVAYYTIKGRNADKITEKGRQEIRATMDRPSPPNPPAPKDTPITADELEICKQLAVNPDRYKQRRVDLEQERQPWPVT